MNKPDLYTLLKQFNAIGGMAETGQPGFCLLMALWQKANELNWITEFTMTNTELLYKAGFNNTQTLINVRNKLKQLKYIDYNAPKNRRFCGTYKLNYDLINIKNLDYSTYLNSDFNRPFNSGFNSGFNRPFNSAFNINKLNQTKPTNIVVVEEETAAAENDEEVKELIKFFSSNIHAAITPVEYQKLISWNEVLNKDLIMFAIEEAAMQNKRTMSYLEGILKNYEKLEIKTKQQALEEKEKWIKSNQQKAVKPNGNNRADTGTKNNEFAGYDLSAGIIRGEEEE